MSALSETPQERARKAFARVLQAMGEPGRQVALAASLGTSESTISRLKTERLEDCITVLYALGFKLVDSNRICVTPGALDFMRQITSRALANECTDLWDDGE